MIMLPIWIFFMFLILSLHSLNSTKTAILGENVYYESGAGTATND